MKQLNAEDAFDKHFNTAGKVSMKGIGQEVAKQIGRLFKVGAAGVVGVGGVLAGGAAIALLPLAIPGGIVGALIGQKIDSNKQANRNRPIDANIQKYGDELTSLDR